MPTKLSLKINKIFINKVYKTWSSVSNSSLFFVLDQKAFAKKGLKRPLTLFSPIPCVVLSLSITGSLLLKVVFNPKITFHQTLSCIKFCLPSNFVFHQKSSSIKDLNPSMVIFPQRLSSIKGRFPSKVVFHQRGASIKGQLPSKVYLSSKVIFHQRSSSIKGRFP